MSFRKGSRSLLGLVTETPIPPASDATATPNILTPAVKGYGQVCVALFDDLNGDSVRQESEPLIADGAVSLVDQTGQTNQTEDTLAGENAVCFNELPEGDYNVSVAVPEGYNPTTSLNSPLKLLAGEISTMNFGAQLNSQTSPISPFTGWA